MVARINGVGNTFLLGSEYAVRIWLNPDKLQGYGLSATQVLNAVNAQNSQFAAGSSARIRPSRARPSRPPSRATRCSPRCSSSATSSCVANSDGTTVRLSDVARITFGGQTYGESARLQRQAGRRHGTLPLPGANALAVAKAVKAQMAMLAQGRCRRA